MAPPTNSSTPVVALEHVSKTFPGVRAVDQVSLAVYPGTVHGLVGENGAGKSTLIKILAGAVPKDAGQIRVHGQPATISHVQDARRLGLAFVHQELNLVPYLDAAENIFLGHPLPQTWYGKIRWRELRRRAAQILDELGCAIPVDVPVARLSPGQQTLVAVARAFAADAALVVMDEPTATLTEREIDSLFAGIRRLVRQGAGILYVSHRLAEIFTITDWVTVMRNGQVVATRPTQSWDQEQLIRAMTGRAQEVIFPPRRQQPGPPVLWAEELHGERIQGVSFTLHQGEVLGIAGLMGSGRSELLHLLFGAARLRGGRLWLQTPAGARHPLTPRSPAHALRHGIALAPEERRTQGLLLSRPVYENVTLTHLARFARGRFLLDRQRELDATQRLAQSLGLKAASLKQPVYQLSGGNQQKVVFARCLAGTLKILLLDEPTRGIDVGAKLEVYKLIQELTAQGVAVVLVSSELPELLALSDRVLVLHEGRPAGILDATGADPEAVLRRCYGVDRPADEPIR